MAWPYLTAAIPGSGGRIKVNPEDFVVEEVPAYQPSGNGTHLFLFVEKVNHDTPWVARRLAAAVGIPEDEVGYAGLKDRAAITRQLFSIPAHAEAKLAEWNESGIRVLWSRRHENKLRSGHLRANRFELRLREVRDPDAAGAAFAALEASGVPNYFGEQRFGAKGANAAHGKALVLGQRLPRAPSKFERRLFLSAYQSELFNRMLADRLERGELGRVLAGDALRKEGSGGVFLCADPSVDQARADAFEISAAGPLFGPKLLPAAGEIAERETALLQREGLTLDDFARGGKLSEGARRAYRVRLEAPEIAVEGQEVRLAFTLPSGSYATVVLEELVKPASAERSK